VIASAVAERAGEGVTIDLAPALLGSGYVHGYPSPITDLFHPTQAGYSTYAVAIKTAID